MSAIIILNVPGAPTVGHHKKKAKQERGVSLPVPLDSVAEMDDVSRSSGMTRWDKYKKKHSTCKMPPKGKSSAEAPNGASNSEIELLMR